jgi:Domain of unknown function (DUF222)/HNH endonuclease
MADGGHSDDVDSETLGSLASALVTISSLEVDLMEGSELAVAVLEAEKLVNAANALSAALLERFEQDGGWAADGALSAAAWTAQRTGSPRASLRSRRRQGAALAHLPEVAAAARQGRLSTEHLAAVSDCVRRHPAPASEQDAQWLEQTETLSAEAFRLVARHWLDAAADLDGPEPRPAPDDEVSHLHISRTFQGWLRIDGCLNPQDADLVEAVLDAGVDRALRDAHDGDPSVAGRPVSTLRAAALVDLAAQAMRREPSDASAPDRYRVAVVVPPGETTVPAEAACDADAYRAVVAAGGEVLDVGRQTSRWPVPIRRAITIRDQGCVFPGCDRPPSWTDIHHCTPWHEGGATSVDNGALLCRRHHTFIHRNHWQVTIDHGLPTTRKPNGTLYTIRRWHPNTQAS